MIANEAEEDLEEDMLFALVELFTVIGSTISSFFSFFFAVIVPTAGTTVVEYNIDPRVTRTTASTVPASTSVPNRSIETNGNATNSSEPAIVFRTESK